MARAIEAQIIGVDIDRELIDKYRVKAILDHISNIHFIQADLSKVDYHSFLMNNEEKADYISNFNMLHFEGTS